MVGGEAGVGKTTLLRRFCSDRPSSTAVLWGSCDPLFTPAPLGPLLDVADAVGGELAAVLGSAASAHDAVAALSRQLRRQPASVLVLEDLHWADEATLDVLRLLARRIDSVPVLVVATFRNDALDPGHPLRLVLGEFPSGSAVRRIGLSSLSRDAVTLLAGPYSVDPDELYAKTSGNPFFVLEVLAGDGAAIPETVRDAVLARAARLSQPARTLLETVAVLTPQADIWLLEALAAEGIGGLDEALTSGMLVPRPGSVAFRHELARLAIEQSTSPHRQLSLHRTALAALGSPPGGSVDLDRLAHHAEAAGDAAAVLEWAPAAAQRATSLGAHREAAAHYARALRFGDLLPAAERAQLLRWLAAACYVTDQYDEGIAALEAALLDLRSCGDRLGEGDVLRRLSEFLWCPGRTAEAERRSREAVTLLEQLPPSPELALAYSNLAEICYSASRWSASLSWGQAAATVAEGLGDPAITLHALTETSVAEFMLVRREHVAELIAQAERHGDPMEIARVYTHAAGAAMSLRRHDQAQSYLSRGLAHCSDHGLELYRLYLLTHRARLLLEQASWTEAAEAAEVVLAIRRTSTTPRILALVVLALVRARRGDPGRWPLLDEAWALAEPTGELPRLGPVAAARAEVAWLDGDADGVARATDDVFPLAVERGAELLIGELSQWRRRAGLTELTGTALVPPYSLEPAAASAFWASMGFPYEAALALADGDRTERESLEQLQLMGARPAATIVAGRLRDRGARGLPRGPRPSTRANSANLTSREMQVLALMADGLRNADIAGRLVISRRTVDHHVATILAKLQVPTRMHAVAEARRLALLPQSR
jgi:DNA-binding CsgD family transcriptional regulator/tetratricopeptide (TPR) repeat protein